MSIVFGFCVATRTVKRTRSAVTESMAKSENATVGGLRSAGGSSEPQAVVPTPASPAANSLPSVRRRASGLERVRSTAYSLESRSSASLSVSSFFAKQKRTMPCSTGSA